MTLTIETASHRLRNGQNFALTMKTLVVLVTWIAFNAVRILGYFFVKKVDWVR